MAVGQKIGKVFGAIGGGLSFIPGPWSALGVALSAGGKVAQQVGAAKDRREAEREREAATNTPPDNQPMPAPDTSRPPQQQSEQPQGQPPPMPGRTFQPRPGGVNLGNYQQQLHMDIARGLLRDEVNDAAF